MSFAPGLFPRLQSLTRQTLLRHLPHHPSPSFRKSLSTIAIPYPKPAQSRSTLYALTVGLGFLSYSALSPSRQIQCQAASSPVLGNTNRAYDGVVGEAPPQSILSLYELGFGTVTGICAGVFLKKGLRAIAFLLGGAFIFLQYMSSRSFITVDWAKISSRYDSTFGTSTSSGVKAPTVTGAWNRVVDFITANFQQRASFLAGFVLGIRLG